MNIDPEELDRLNKTLINEFGEDLVEMITFAASVKTLIVNNADMHPHIKARQEMLLGELLGLWLAQHKVSMPTFITAHAAVAQAFDTLSILASNAEAELQMSAARDASDSIISQARARH